MGFRSFFVSVELIAELVGDHGRLDADGNDMSAGIEELEVSSHPFGMAQVLGVVSRQPHDAGRLSCRKDEFLFSNDRAFLLMVHKLVISHQTPPSNIVPVF